MIPTLWSDSINFVLSVHFTFTWHANNFISINLKSCPKWCYSKKRWQSQPLQHACAVGRKDCMFAILHNPNPALPVAVPSLFSTPACSQSYTIPIPHSRWQSPASSARLHARTPGGSPRPFQQSGVSRLSRPCMLARPVAVPKSPSSSARLHARNLTQSQSRTPGGSPQPLQLKFQCQ